MDSGSDVKASSGQGAGRRVAHGTFRLVRTFDAPVERVFEALSDEDAKGRWFGGEEGMWKPIVRSMDFYVGGREHLKGEWENGRTSTFDAIYYDIVPNERIVYAYEMHIDDEKISVSLATLQLTPTTGGTTLTVVEQGVFLDGNDDGSRERGTAHLLDRLAATLHL